MTFQLDTELVAALVLGDFRRFVELSSELKQ